MKLMFVNLLCIITLCASTCKNEEGNSHYIIQIKNNSSNQIIPAIPVRTGDGKCTLDGKILNNGGQDNYRPFNFSIENSMNNKTSIEIYIVDPTKFNTPHKYYSCDSIEINNKVLKHYLLTLEDLKNNNFTVTYP